MLSHNQLKHLRALSVKKYREQHGHFVVEGEKMVGELLRQSRIGISAIYGLERWAHENLGLIRGFSDRWQAVTESELGKISGLNTPNKAVAVANIPLETCEFRLPSQGPCFYLDGIQDPGNMGSILRVADWFGFPAVYCSPDCVDVFSPKVVQASMGSIFRIQTWEIELAELLSKAPEIPVAGALLDGEDVFKANLPRNGLVVIGNEGRGISSRAEQVLTHRIGIPRHPAGNAESLNAAVAAGIIAAVFRR